MARFITAKELDKKIAELQKARQQMTHKDDRVCEACLSLTKIGLREDILQCYCDWPGTPDID